MSAPLPQELMTFAEVARALPNDSRGRRVSTSTVWRWANKGLGGRKLKCIRMGRRSVTTWAWVLEFFGLQEAYVETDTRNTAASKGRSTEQALDRWGV